MRRIRTVAAGLALLLAPLSAGLAGTAGTAAADPHGFPANYGQPIDSVIQRALSQRGVPYVYGGGNVSGPTAPPSTVQPPNAAQPQPPAAGQPPGAFPAPGGTPGAAAAPTVGFDSSGLIQYAFAAAGITMPRTSGEQCSVGRKVVPAQALPGDLLCYGPGGTQSVALYLGNGRMIEGTEPAVTVSPVRTTNMVPYLTRVIG